MSLATVRSADSSQLLRLVGAPVRSTHAVISNLGLTNPVSAARSLGGQRHGPTGDPTEDVGTVQPYRSPRRHRHPRPRPVHKSITPLAFPSVLSPSLRRREPPSPRNPASSTHPGGSGIGRTSGHKLLLRSPKFRHETELHDTGQAKCPSWTHVLCRYAPSASALADPFLVAAYCDADSVHR
jgi:hypothetical protein